MLDFLIVRPVEMKDLDQVYTLALHTANGLSTLPKDKRLIQEKISQSLASFSKQIKQVSDELYFFVLEDTQAKRIVGTASILASVGVNDAFYSYKIVQKQNLLKQVYHELHLDKQWNGPSELGTLYVLPEYRKKGVGRFLSLSRFIFIAIHKKRFKDEIISELRGASDSEGSSPFWKHVMKHFFDMPFAEADLQTQRDKSFIEEGLPTSPLILETLPKQAQEVIGQTHDYTVGAKRILEDEGLSLSNHVDIFDAGPKLSAKRDDLKVFSRLKIVPKYSLTESLSNAVMHIVASGRLSDFRACCTSMTVAEDKSCVIMHSPALAACTDRESSLVRLPLYVPKSMKDYFSKGNNFLQNFSFIYRLFSLGVSSLKEKL